MEGRGKGRPAGEELLRAMELVRAGATRTKAARETGIGVTKITRSKLYREWVAQQAAGAAQNKGE